MSQYRKPTVPANDLGEIQSPRLPINTKVKVYYKGRFVQGKIGCFIGRTGVYGVLAKWEGAYVGQRNFRYEDITVLSK